MRRGVYWSHEDPVTKTKRMTSAAGAVTSSTVLDPWGGEAAGRWALNTSQQRRKYTTYERDADGGDEAMRRRYSAWWARFSQPDPYDGSYDLTDPRSLNRYSYAQNDPVNFTDPTGLDEDVVRIEAWTWRWIEMGGGGKRDFEVQHYLLTDMLLTVLQEPTKPSHDQSTLPNYCQRFADIVAEIAQGSRSDRQFVNRLRRRFEASPGTREYSEFRGRGFRLEFQDEGNSFNQVRHFVGGLVRSFYGAIPAALTGQAAMVTYRSQLFISNIGEDPNTESGRADRAVNAHSVLLGVALAYNSGGRGGVASYIRNVLCDPNMP